MPPSSIELPGVPRVSTIGEEVVVVDLLLLTAMELLGHQLAGLSTRMSVTLSMNNSAILFKSSSAELYRSRSVALLMNSSAIL